MSEFINTVDEYGDEQTGALIISREIASFYDNVIDIIDRNAFAYCFNLTHVECPNVSYIRYSAFYADYRLRYISFPSLRSIESCCFYNCGLDEARFNGISRLAEYAFNNCQSLKFFSAESASGAISSHAFQGCCKLKSVYLPLVTQIYSSAFEDCLGLESINLPAVTEIFYGAFANCYRLRSLSFPLLSRLSTPYAFQHCAAITEIRDSFSNVSSIIGASCFAECYRLQSVTLPKVSLLSNSVFAYCNNVINVSLESCKILGAFAFTSCFNLKSISIPEVTSIGNGTFASCFNLESISFPKLEILEGQPFTSCGNLKAIFLLNSSIVSLRSQNVFSTCNYYLNIYVPDDLVDSYKSATNWSTYASIIKGISEFVSIPSGETLSIIDLSPHSWDRKIEYLIDSSVTSLGYNQFAGCNIKYISLPSLLTVGRNCFQYNKCLSSVYLPNVQIVSYNAFDMCYALEQLELSNCLSIETAAFSYCVKLETVSLPKITSLATSVFSHCYKLKSCYIPLLSVLKDDCFYWCTALETIDLPSVTSIGKSVFGECHDLKEVSLPNVEYIGSNAFIRCAIESISLPKIKRIYESAFYLCELKTMFIGGDSVVSITSTTFTGFDQYSGIIYVPDSLVTSYKSASYWSKYSSNIYAHSQMPSE